MQEIGKLLIMVGAIIILMGLMILVISKMNERGNFKLLPGDIVIRKKNFVLIVPITSMILLSLVLTLIMTIISKFFK
ncbi:MAG: DUF2905 domain-containing protein [Fervidobacterium sp.]